MDSTEMKADPVHQAERRSGSPSREPIRLAICRKPVRLVERGKPRLTTAAGSTSRKSGLPSLLCGRKSAREFR
ncbi:MAG: hypothetical protein WA746_17440 [Isosphaeraceae bacterium]